MLLRRSVSVLNARLMDVQMLLRIKEFAFDMVPLGRRRFASMKDVQMLFKRQVFVLVMVPGGSPVAMKVVQKMPRKEEFVVDMAPSKLERYAAMKDVQMLL